MPSTYSNYTASDYYQYFYNSFLRSNNSLPINNLWVVVVNGIPNNLQNYYNNKEPKASNLLNQQIITKARQFVDGQTQNRGIVISQGVTEVGDGFDFKREGYSNGGYLKGILSNSRNDLNQFQISLLETDTSFLDFVIRPWIIALSYEGLTNKELLATDVTIIHYSKSHSNIDYLRGSVRNAKKDDVPYRFGDSAVSTINNFIGGNKDKIESNVGPLLVKSFIPRKVFTYHNCFPIGLDDSEYNYTGDDVVKKINVKFGYTSYTVEIGSTEILNSQELINEKINALNYDESEFGLGSYFKKLGSDLVDKLKTYGLSLEQQLIGGIGNTVQSTITDSIDSVVRSAESVGIGFVNGINTKVGNAASNLSGAVANIANKLATEALNKIDLSKGDGTSIDTAINSGADSAASSSKLKIAEKKTNNFDTVTFTVKNEFKPPTTPTPVPPIKVPNKFDTVELKDFNTINAAVTKGINPSDSLGYPEQDVIGASQNKPINKDDIPNFLTLPNNGKGINKDDTPVALKLGFENQKNVSSDDVVSFKVTKQSEKVVNQNDTVKTLNYSDKQNNKNDTVTNVTNNIKLINQNDTVGSLTYVDKVIKQDDVVRKS